MMLLKQRQVGVTGETAPLRDRFVGEWLHITTAAYL